MHPIKEQILNLPDSDFERMRREIEQALQARQMQLDAKRRQQRYKKEESRKEREEVVGLAAKQWCQKYLRPGMKVKVKGTRDGSGLREVTEVHPSVLVGRQLIKRKQPKRDANGDLVRSQVDPKRKVYETVLQPSTEYTTNGLDKVRQVEIDGEWKKIKELTGV